MIRGYDQWKTASPYDDDPDWIDEAESWLKRADKPNNEDEAVPIEIIKGLLEVLEDEGIIKTDVPNDSRFAKTYHNGYRAGWNDATQETKKIVIKRLEELIFS